MKNRISIICLITGIAWFSACKWDNEEDARPQLNTIPEFYPKALKADYGKTPPDFIVIANAAQKLSIPQDLDFHPTRPDEIWLVNKGTEAYGGTTVIINNPGEPTQSALFRKDASAG